MVKRERNGILLGLMRLRRGRQVCIDTKEIGMYEVVHLVVEYKRECARRECVIVRGTSCHVSETKYTETTMN